MIISTAAYKTNVNFLIAADKQAVIIFCDSVRTAECIVQVKVEIFQRARSASSAALAKGTTRVVSG